MKSSWISRRTSELRSPVSKRSRRRASQTRRTIGEMLSHAGIDTETLEDRTLLAVMLFVSDATVATESHG